MPDTVEEHIAEFEKNWMHDLVNDFPDVSEDELYADGLRAYLASEVDSKKMRLEIARRKGVYVDRDGF